MMNRLLLTSRACELKGTKGQMSDDTLEQGVVERLWLPLAWDVPPAGGEELS
jgi:hypothetical protein